MTSTPAAAFLPLVRDTSHSGFSRIVADLTGKGASQSPKFQITLEECILRFQATANNPTPNCDPALKPGDFVEGLWERDVAELFLRDPASQRYVEVNLSPTGAWWIMTFDGKLKRTRTEPLPPFESAHTGLKTKDGWEASVDLPLDWLGQVIDFDPTTTTGNVTFILGDGAGGSDRQFLSWCKLSSPTPDYHTADDFPPLSARAMMNALLVGLGGFLGAICRYGTGVALSKWLDPTKFPAATFAVNLIGCFIIGLVFGLGDNAGGLKREVQLFVCIGFLGGFTTFSAFGNEALALMRTGRLGLALTYVAVSVVAGVFLVWVGYLTAGMMGSRR